MRMSGGISWRGILSAGHGSPTVSLSWGTWLPSHVGGVLSLAGPTPPPPWLLDTVGATWMGPWSFLPEATAFRACWFGWGCQIEVFTFAAALERRGLWNSPNVSVLVTKCLHVVFSVAHSEKYRFLSAWAGLTWPLSHYFISSLAKASGHFLNSGKKPKTRRMNQPANQRPVPEPGLLTSITFFPALSCWTQVRRLGPLCWPQLAPCGVDWLLHGSAEPRGHPRRLCMHTPFSPLYCSFGHQFMFFINLFLIEG